MHDDRYYYTDRSNKYVVAQKYKTMVTFPREYFILDTRELETIEGCVARCKGQKSTAIAQFVLGAHGESDNKDAITKLKPLIDLEDDCSCA